MLISSGEVGAFGGGFSFFLFFFFVFFYKEVKRCCVFITEGWFM